VNDMHLDASTFQTQIIGEFWARLATSLDRIESVMADCTIEELNWRPPAPDTNSIYVIGVHALGHLRQCIIGVLGEGSQERDRDAEFRAVATPGNVPVPGWDATRHEMVAVLQGLGPEVLDRVYEPLYREPMTGMDLLFMMVRHTALHEGHAELTRDLARAALHQS
jgi:hypothetical protein